MEPPYQLVTTSAALARLMTELRTEPILALDTEASSFHRYKERICLIQLSTRSKTWLIDPLTVEDMEPFGKVVADPAVELVIHDADYDLRILAKHHGIRVENVFDTLVAAELLNEPEIGLAALLQKYQGVHVDKKFQKADWSKRPLPQHMLAYAAGDTANLIALRDVLKEKLIAKDRWSWAEEEFALLTDAPFNLAVNEEPGFLRLKGAKLLKPQQLAVLREVHTWREGVAEKMDRASFMVLGNDVLLSLAADPPKTVKDIASRKGVGERVVERHGRNLLAAVKRGVELPKEEWPRVPKANGGTATTTTRID